MFVGARWTLRALGGMLLVLGFAGALTTTTYAQEKDDKAAKDSAGSGVDEKERAKIERLWSKKFGTKEDNFWVVGTLETKIVQEEGAAPKMEYTPRFVTIEGGPKTAEFVIDYMTKYPAANSKARKRKKGDNTPQPPVREILVANQFPDSKRATDYQYAVQEEFKKKIEQAKAAQGQ